MALAADIVSWTLMGAGALFLLIAGVGILRLPDVFTRMHAAGIGDTLGAGLILAGLMFQSGFSLVTVKLVFVLILLFVTSPTATHALAKAALTGNVKPLLAEDLEGEKSKR
ncbi:MAG TPA: monovalent cation/H(+) antiporter subunit G [Alphaproteobacteria bacterium]|nr:monovalent cation/H(+) antiporter subunit G [Alphaproteobacteria bacterium]